MGGRGSAQGATGRTLAVGVDLASPVLEVARRGFHTTFSNQMRQLGCWFAGPVLHLADDVVGEIARREGAPDDVVVGVAAPGWLGWGDRHHVASLIDPNGHDRLTWMSSTVAAVAACTPAAEADALVSEVLVREVVVAVDLDLGISASLVAVDATSMREVAAVAIPPRLGLDGIRPVDVAAVLDELAASARRAGIARAHRLVLVASRAARGRAADDPAAAAARESVIASLIDQAMRSVDLAWGECPVDVVRTRAEIARAAVRLVDGHSVDLVGVVPRSVGVLLDDADTGRSRVHVIVPRDTPTPMCSTASFDVGPDDGATVHLDVYEEHPPDLAGHAGDRRSHRMVLTARLDTRRPGVEHVDVAFAVTPSGQLRIEPAGADGADTWNVTWTASRMVVTPGSPHHRGEEDPSVAASVASAGGLSRLGRTRALAAPLELGDALGRAERLVSRAVGRVVAIRSVPALVGCADADDPSIVGEHVDRMARVLDMRPHDPLTTALAHALEISRRTLEVPNGRIYVGGTMRDVAHELGRVVEHLAIVIGAVTPAERNRLIADAHLLGLDHDRARRMIDELIDEAGVTCDGKPEALDDPTATVVVSMNGIELVPAPGALDHDQTSIRVVILDR